MRWILVLASLTWASVAVAAGPSYEYKLAKTGRVKVSGLNVGKIQQLGMQEVERLMTDNATDGWRLASVTAIQEDAYGGYSFICVFERQKGVTYVASAPVVAAPVESTPAPTPRPERTPRPPPTNDPCVDGTPCIVETYLGSEITVEVGKKYNVKLKSGDLFNGTITSAKRLEIIVDLGGTKGSATVRADMLSGLTPL